jgi:hypothetical protein
MAGQHKHNPRGLLLLLLLWWQVLLLRPLRPRERQ